MYTTRELQAWKEMHFDRDKPTSHYTLQEAVRQMEQREAAQALSETGKRKDKVTTLLAALDPHRLKEAYLDPLRNTSTVEQRRAAEKLLLLDWETLQTLLHMQITDPHLDARKALRFLRELRRELEKMATEWLSRARLKELTAQLVVLRGLTVDELARDTPSDLAYLEAKHGRQGSEWHEHEDRCFLLAAEGRDFSEPLHQMSRIDHEKQVPPCQWVNQLRVHECCADGTRSLALDLSGYPHAEPPIYGSFLTRARRHYKESYTPKLALHIKQVLHNKRCNAHPTALDRPLFGLVGSFAFWRALPSPTAAPWPQPIVRPQANDVARDDMYAPVDPRVEDALSERRGHSVRLSAFKAVCELLHTISPDDAICTRLTRDGVMFGFLDMEKLVRRTLTPMQAMLCSRSWRSSSRTASLCSNRGSTRRSTPPCSRPSAGSRGRWRSTCDPAVATTQGPSTST